MGGEKQIFQEKECAASVPTQFPHLCVCERFIYSKIGLQILLQENTGCGPILGIYKSLTDT